MIIIVGILTFHCFSQDKILNEFPSAQKSIQIDSIGRPNQNIFYIPVEATNSIGVTYSQEKKKGILVSYYDTNLTKSISQFLYSLDEPILSVKYTDKDMFRFVMIQPPKLKMLIRFVRQYDSLEIKFASISLDTFPKSNVHLTTKTIILPIAYWDTLSMMLDYGKFWTTMPTTIDVNQTQEFSQEFIWILEGHKIDGYRVVSRWGFRSDEIFSEICLYMLALSKVPELRGVEYTLSISPTPTSFIKGIK